MLGDTEPIVNRPVRSGSVQSGRSTNVLCGHARFGLHGLGRILLIENELAPVLVGIQFAPIFDIRLGFQALGKDDVCHRVDHRDIGARPDRQMVVCLDVRGAHEINSPGICHNQLGSLPQSALHLGGEHRMSLGRIRANHQDDIRVEYRVEGLRPGRLAEGRFQAVAGR